MRIGNYDISVDDAVKFAENEKYILKRRNNNLLLNDYQISILSEFGIDYNNYTSLEQLIFDIEEILWDEYDNRLDLVNSQLAELNYYLNTKK